jgi:hypothetical protein
MADLAADLLGAAERGLQSFSLKLTDAGAWHCMALYSHGSGHPYGLGVRATPVAALQAALTDTRGTVLPAPEEDVFG